MEIPKFEGFDFLPVAAVETASTVEENRDEAVVDCPTDEEIQLEADEIAKKIVELLIESFKMKENRDPTEEEIEQLRDELTTERIAQLLGQSNEEDAESDEDADDEEDDEKEDDDDVETAVKDDDAKKRSHDCTDEVSPEKKSKHDVTASNDENIVVN